MVQQPSDLTRQHIMLPDEVSFSNVKGKVDQKGKLFNNLLTFMLLQTLEYVQVSNDNHHDFETS